MVLAADALSPDRKDCHSGGCDLEAVIVEDGDDLLSLVQVKAVATRNNRTYVNKLGSNTSETSVVSEMSHTSKSNKTGLLQTVSEAPETSRSNHTGLLQTNKSSDLLEITSNIRFAMESGGITPVYTRSRAWPVLYTLVIVCIIVFVVHSSRLCQARLGQKDDGKVQSLPKMKYGVDHLVATSKLKTRSSLFDNEARHHTDIFLESQKVCCPLKPSETPTSIDKAQNILGEALDPKLVLPLRETWYAVSLENALSADGSFEVLRITGDPSIQASIRYNSSDGGELELFCGGAAGSRSNLLARASTEEVLERPEACSRPPVSLIGAEGRDLGELRPLTCKKLELIRDGTSVLTLAVDDEGQLEMMNPSGSRLAGVSCVAGHLAIFINAGTDSGLIICIVLAAVLLAGAGPHVFPRGWVKPCAACGSAE
jgi:hypothetical protein